jgi:cytochrome c-type biogenesis protein CcmH/NrfG
LTLGGSGRVLAQLHELGLARSALEKAIAVDPWRSEYHRILARVCFRARDWRAAVAACREAIRLNPDSLDARSLLVQSYLHSHQPEKADAEFRTVVRFYPASREVWQEWYEREKAKPGDAEPAAKDEPPG